MTLWLKEWLTGMIAAATVLSLVYILIPRRTVNTVARFTGGLILLLVIVRPLMEIKPDALKMEYRSCQQEVERQIAFYQEDHETQMAAIIEEKTAAYISKKASELGISCRITVETEVRDGVPIPSRISLQTPRDEPLSRWIEEEIGIPRDAQTWEVEQ